MLLAKFIVFFVFSSTFWVIPVFAESTLLVVLGFYFLIGFFSMVFGFPAMGLCILSLSLYLRFVVYMYVHMDRIMGFFSWVFSLRSLYNPVNFLAFQVTFFLLILVVIKFSPLVISSIFYFIPHASAMTISDVVVSVDASVAMDALSRLNPPMGELIAPVPSSEPMESMWETVIPSFFKEEGCINFGGGVDEWLYNEKSDAAGLSDISSGSDRMLDPLYLNPSLSSVYSSSCGDYLDPNGVKGGSCVGGECSCKITSITPSEEDFLRSSLYNYSLTDRIHFTNDWVMSIPDVDSGLDVGVSSYLSNCHDLEPSSELQVALWVLSIGCVEG